METVRKNAFGGCPDTKRFSCLPLLRKRAPFTKIAQEEPSLSARCGGASNEVLLDYVPTLLRKKDPSFCREGAQWGRKLGLLPRVADMKAVQPFENKFARADNGPLARQQRQRSLLTLRRARILRPSRPSSPGARKPTRTRPTQA